MGKKSVRIAVVRHGQKDGDALTPLGERQIAAATKVLLGKVQFFRIAHSPFNRTTQCATIAQNIRNHAAVLVDKDVDGLSFKKPFAKAYDSNMQIYEEELAVIQANGNTVAAGMRVSKYAPLASQQLSDYLVSLAKDLQKHKEKCAICFSHSPYHTLAVPEALADQFPYQGDEASCVLYTITDGQITDAQYLPCPPVE